MGQIDIPDFNGSLYAMRTWIVALITLGLAQAAHAQPAPMFTDALAGLLAALMTDLPSRVTSEPIQNEISFQSADATAAALAQVISAIAEQTRERSLTWRHLIEVLVVGNDRLNLAQLSLKTEPATGLRAQRDERFFEFIETRMAFSPAWVSNLASRFPHLTDALAQIDSDQTRAASLVKSAISQIKPLVWDRLRLPSIKIAVWYISKPVRLRGARALTFHISKAGGIRAEMVKLPLPQKNVCDQTVSEKLKGGPLATNEG